MFRPTKLVQLPDGISDEIAAAILLKGMTAQYLLRQIHRVKAGETIVFHAAAGGVGQIGVPMGQASGRHRDRHHHLARRKSRWRSANGCAHVLNTQGCGLGKAGA